MAHISIYRIVRKVTLCYLVQVDDVLVSISARMMANLSISRIVHKMTLRYLVQVDDVLVLHLGEDVYLLFYVLHGDSPPAAVQSLLFDVLCRVLSPEIVRQK
jgi:hypothetical protein